MKKAGEKEKTERIIKGMGDLLARVSRYYGVNRNDILNSRVKEVREARILLVYMGCEYFKKSGTEMGKVLRITQEAASIARGGMGDDGAGSAWLGLVGLGMKNDKQGHLIVL